MSAREVITIQCGHFSNFIGTHWWNIQEAEFCYDDASKGSQEILHDCTFREGLTLAGEQTYTPRLIALDLPGTQSGSLKGLKEEGVLYETAAAQTAYTPAWEGKMETHTEPPHKSTLLTDLERMDAGGMEETEVMTSDLDLTVEVWSDFLCTHLHPRSLLMLPGYFHNDQNGAFDTYPAGLQVWENRKFRHAFEDQLHFFAEECDRLQGFQLLVDWESGFGAVGHGIVQEIEDEFGTNKVMALAASSLVQPLDKMSSYWTVLLNNALTLDGLCTHCSTLCPLSLLPNPWNTHDNCPLEARTFPHLQYKPSLLYHSSAIMASALETTTLLYRTEHPATTLPALCDSLTALGRKVCGMGLCLPLSLSPGSSLLAGLDSAPLHSTLLTLTPFCTPEDVRWSQAISIRGIPPSCPLCAMEDPRFLHCQHPSDVIANHLAEHSPNTQSLFQVVQKPFPVCTSFPNLFAHSSSSKEVPMCASLSSQSGVQQLLTTLLAKLKSTNVRRFPVYASSCLDQDSLSELCHSLATMADNYQTESCPEENSDSDD